jgi:putative phosphoribosyl transferase
MTALAPARAAVKFRDRAEGGRLLAEQLLAYAGRPEAIVLALPRGGVPVAFEIATRLRVPLDIFLVRKLGVPGQPELAMGAIASGGARFLNEDVIRYVGARPETIELVARDEQIELERREQAYRGDRAAPDLQNRHTILVDDGLATGSSMRAAITAVRMQRPACIIVAVPVAAREACEDLTREVDEVICLRTPEPFSAVGLWYEDFSQTEDDEVRALLQRAANDLIQSTSSGTDPHADAEP